MNNGFRMTCPDKPGREVRISGRTTPPFIGGVRPPSGHRSTSVLNSGICQRGDVADVRRIVPADGPHVATPIAPPVHNSRTFTHRFEHTNRAGGTRRGSPPPPSLGAPPRRAGCRACRAAAWSAA